MTSERIKKIQAKLSKKAVEDISKLQDILPYLDESEAYAFWLAIEGAFLDGQAFQLDLNYRTIANTLNEAKKHGGVK